MTGIVALLLATLALCCLDWRVTAANVSSYNGYGAISGVLRKDNTAPMRYRVLVPWVMRVLYQVGKWCRPGFELKVWHYQAVKGTLVLLALASAQSVLGTPGMWLMALLMASTLEFDYWDCYAELAGVCLVLSGSPWLASIGAVLWGLSRETAMLAPVLAYTAGGWICGLAACTGPLAMYAVRRIQGHAELYCKRWTFRAYNCTVDLALVYSLALSLATVAALVWGRQEMAPALARTAWAPLAWLTSGWTMARARETRIYLPAFLWLVAGIS